MDCTPKVGMEVTLLWFQADVYRMMSGEQQVGEGGRSSYL